ATTRLQEKSKIIGYRPGYNLPLLAKNQQGYRNLCKLSSIGYLEGFYYYPRIDFELLKQHHEGLICLDGSMGTLLAHEIVQGNKEKVSQHIATYRELFGEDYYFDLQRHEMSDDAIQTDGFNTESWLIQQYQEFITKQKKVNTSLIEFSRT